MLPAVLFALEEELRLPAVAGEGPFALILVPNRELADQIHGIIEEYFFCLAKYVLTHVCVKKKKNSRRKRYHNWV